MSTLPSVEDVQRYTTEQVISFLRNENSNFNDDDFNILRRQRVSGSAFLRLNEQKLLNPPFNLHGGLASDIAELVKKLNHQSKFHHK